MNSPTGAGFERNKRAHRRRRIGFGAPDVGLIDQ